ncbi:serine/threonine protein kinase [Archangium gephyra]|uniref:non-specific serine/threonine protein kinase n=1 Tax=Archangium gephyra TaxID=48 RepID=A0AAC8Q7S4_9BACT|nr:serine/threonine-protein kinase [Archangium gephyra]AKJ02441.1 serine/threonine protein kinase [Archangium gephyra]REG28633.1 serine/threonine protein kinase [Archangium gephyra]
MEPPSPTHVGPYRLLHPLGSGGMGQVFAAIHETTGQQVALKLLSPTAVAAPQLVARFLQEARVMNQLDHPGVVRVFHWDRLGDLVFLTMELLQGLSLREWLRSQSGPAPLPSALALCRQIADTMVDVHARGIVHRDLKPENVFLCRDEAVAPGYRVKLLDFGIAKVPPGADGALTTQVHTHESTLMGTYLYIAPEQLLNASTVDGGADVYALGVLLFELLAGRTPFASEEPVELIAAHVNKEPPPLKQWVPALPGALSAFIASMLAKNPAERPTMQLCRDTLGRPWQWEQDVCPVPGLAPFTEAQAELFFGRKAETQALLDLLEEARVGTRRWVQLEGLSGVGKSSLLQAGLLPRLKEPSAQQAPRWLVATVRPSYEPVRNLARALAGACSSTETGGRPEELEQLLRRGGEALRTFVETHTPQDCRLLLVLEPMEELFTLGTAECSLMDELLSTALASPESSLRLLTSLRSDFLHRIEQMPLLARGLQAAARFPLLPMEDEALTQVIQGMARYAGLRLSEGLAERMVKDARSEGGRLPLLGHTLRGLWSQSGGALLTHEHYERLGGVGGALARQAESLLDGLGVEGRERARWILLELVQVSRGVPATRRPRSRQEVLAAAGNDELAKEVLLRLTGMHTGHGPAQEQGLRLVMLSGGPDPSQQRVDLMHETLLHKVPSLATSIEQERARLELHAELESNAHRWEELECPKGALPTGTLLTHYLGGPEMRRQGSLETRRVSPRAARYLEAALRLERMRAWVRRALVAASLMAGMAILFYAALANQERRRAETEQQRAEENLRRIIKATDDFVDESDWELSWLPYTLDQRRKLLQGFQQTLDSLSKEEQRRPEVRLTIIKVAQRLGDISYYDDTLAEAETWLLRAREHIRQGLDLHPGDEELLEQLALNHSKRGKVAMALGHWEEARVLLNESLGLLETSGPSGNDEKSQENHRRTLAVTLSELAELELAAGNLEESARLSDQAISLHGKNRGIYNEALLALTGGFRGEVALKMGDLPTAERQFEQALRLIRNCVRSHEGDQYFHWVLARVLVGLGTLQSAKEQFKDATESFGEVRGLGKTLLQGEPPNKRFALVLAHGLRAYEAMARHRGALSEADSLHDELCKRVRDFRDRDGKDVRFQSLGCQDITVKGEQR